MTYTVEVEMESGECYLPFINYGDAINLTHAVSHSIGFLKATVRGSNNIVYYTKECSFASYNGM